MLGLNYRKAGPTTYVIQFVNGKAMREGPGLSFFYFGPNSVIVHVPLSSVDVPFVFNETSADFQDVAIQGQLTYRISDPKRVAQLLDFSVYPNGRYVSEDPRKLGERLVMLTQVLASSITHRLKLREVLASHERIVSEVLAGLKESPQVAMLGVEIIGLSVTSIKPSPDMAKALEADAREGLLRMADEAVYARRNAAVAQERLIKESELNTEIAIDEKKRQIREAKMAADIAAEKQRVALLEQRVENERKDADAKAYTLNAMLVPLKGVDWHMLMALNAGNIDAKQTIAMAFRDLADRAEKIGELNISPDLLGKLLGDAPPRKQSHAMRKQIDQKIVIITRATQLASLRRKFNTRSQAKFQIISAKKRQLAASAPAGMDLEAVASAAFQEVDDAAAQYENAVQQLRDELDFSEFELPVQTIDREFLPNFVFGPHDVVVTVGQDGLVANTAKYALGLPIVAVNPDPQRIDGVLLPFRADQAKAAVRGVLNGHAKYREVTLAEATLADGQKLLAFNELFIGVRSHTSARYRLTIANKTEPQSSSGMLVCTGAGSTGWLSSVLNMAAGVAGFFGRPPQKEQIRFEWEDPRLLYVVREPFVSKSSSADLVAGILAAGQEITIESEMASSGVIFSDGVEADALEFNAGAIARIGAAAGKARLVV